MKGYKVTIQASYNEHLYAYYAVIAENETEAIELVKKKIKGDNNPIIYNVREIDRGIIIKYTLFK